MRSKLVVWGYLVVLSLGTILSLYMPKTEAAAKESIVIPGEAIRLRILANSDFESDQAIKRKVRDAVNAQITLWVQDLTSMEKAKTVLTSKLPEIQEIAERTVREQGSDQSVKVEFGKVQFPTKLYGQFLYPAGEYQAILITLGEGEGANWWCVLYPPLCFLDFSNGVAVSEGFEEEKKAKAEMAPKAEVKPDQEQAGATVQDQNQEEEELVDHKKFTASEEQEVVEHKKTNVVEKEAVKKEEKKTKKQVQKNAPVYTEEDEEPVKVKFFVLEMWEKLMY
nr:stage II sporulation protein R [Bacillus sp. SLBN-46]